MMCNRDAECSSQVRWFSDGQSHIRANPVSFLRAVYLPQAHQGEDSPRFSLFETPFEI